MVLICVKKAKHVIPVMLYIVTDFVPSLFAVNKNLDTMNICWK